MNLADYDIHRYSWHRAGLEIRESPLQGKGVFTATAIKPGELVIVWGGIVVTYGDFASGTGLPHSNIGLSETHCLVAPNDEGLSLDDYMNHSCDPNLWLDGPIRLIARRPIAANEELTFDYAIEVGHETYVMKTQCQCAAANCRGTITGRDWRIPNIQRTYHGHFSPFISARIQSLNSSDRRSR
ncbi:MAG: SET domain-containing protein-lysine N-methyltransferase [Xanthomonadaceae bacterium]|nr:SET domain-containing protein-lysine N-methyltransferase [Xanthomonadaceae bacterium]